MLKGPHSSVSSASDLQSRGPGFDPQSGRGIVISENIMSNTYVKHMSNTYELVIRAICQNNLILIVSSIFIGRLMFFNIVYFI